MTLAFSSLAVFAGPNHSGRETEIPESSHLLKGHVESSGSWDEEIETLKSSVPYDSSQIRMLHRQPQGASADNQEVTRKRRNSMTTSVQTQMLRKLLEESTAESKRLKDDLKTANSLNSQTQNFLKSISENTNHPLSTLSRELQDASEIQMLNSSVQNVSSQIQMLNIHLQGASADLQEVKGELRNAKTWSVQTQTLRSSLEGSSAEIQRLKDGLKTANDLHAQTQSFLRTTSENTNHSLSALSRELQEASANIQTLRVDLARASAQAQLANRSLEIANTQILFLRESLDSISLLKTQSQALNSSLQGANAVIHSLKDDLENTKAFMVKVREEQNRLSTLNQTLASQMLLQKKTNELLQLLVQGWKAYGRNLYYFSDDKKSWHEAEEFCKSQGAHLASVTSPEEQPDNWKDKDGQTEDCVHVQKLWNDIHCSASFPWVCKKPMGEEMA
ncbi:PREDICTED: C-type lectin domain family 4 member F [Elephantulus edwardii]|uniref:C-type lectin domain family 4 member F n=1 Tax=Elephantulus edwardii TaxID=28737 RepID=UPI0003F0AB13|nr:PREDICTED: C-type lectin domain family 4 member F [Elephantulus edwardii]